MATRARDCRGFHVLLRHRHHLYNDLVKWARVTHRFPPCVLLMLALRSQKSCQYHSHSNRATVFSAKVVADAFALYHATGLNHGILNHDMRNARPRFPLRLFPHTHVQLSTPARETLTFV